MNREKRPRQYVEEIVNEPLRGKRALLLAAVPEHMRPNVKQRVQIYFSIMKNLRLHKQKHNK